MTQKKKLQVFVSSTYTDLHDERQAAVQAILTAGHIPAGMELFAAGDETQMNAIKRWIDESDVYMLIMGGRYGSIEPKSQKSYIHLEYEYALEKGKPLFAVVIDEGHLDEKVRKDGLKAIEKDYPNKLKDFRELVCSKMVRFWSDPKDIKLAIMETMADFNNREELVGWISGSERINVSAVADEITRLAKENSLLREKLENLSSDTRSFNGLSFKEMYQLLNSINIENLKIQRGLIFGPIDVTHTLKDVANLLGHKQPTLLHYLLIMSHLFTGSLDTAWIDREDPSFQLNLKLHEFGLIEEIEKINGRGDRDCYYELSSSGKQFLLRLRLEYAIDKIESYFIPI